MNKNLPLHYNPMDWSTYDLAKSLMAWLVFGTMLWGVIALAGCGFMKEYDYNSKPMFEQLERNKY